VAIELYDGGGGGGGGKGHLPRKDGLGAGPSSSHG